MSKRRKRRAWSDDEKRLICSQTRAPGVSVAQVARRYALNANQVFNWLTDARYTAGEDGDDGSRFLPVEIVEANPPERAVPSEGVIELDLAGGHRLRVIGRFDPDALTRRSPPEQA